VTPPNLAFERVALQDTSLCNCFVIGAGVDHLGEVDPTIVIQAVKTKLNHTFPRSRVVNTLIRERNIAVALDPL
jgi:hypothetical protein